MMFRTQQRSPYIISELENAIIAAKAKINELQEQIDNKKANSLLLLIHEIDPNCNHCSNYVNRIKQMQLVIVEENNNIENYEQNILGLRDKKDNGTYEDVKKLLCEDDIPIQTNNIENDKNVIKGPESTKEDPDYSRLVGIITLLIVIGLLFYTYSK